MREAKPQLERAAVNAEYVRGLAQTLSERAERHWQTGQLDQAGAAIDGAAALLEDLVRHESATPADRLQLARTEMTRGDWRAARQNARAADTCHDRALSLLEGLRDEYPTAAVYQLDLALVHCSRAAWLARTDQAPGALRLRVAADYDRAKALLEGLADQPEDPAFQRRLARRALRWAGAC